MHWSGLIEEYKTYLPVGDDTPRLTLYEGGTPLIRLDTLSQKFEANLYAKVEGQIGRAHV